MQLSQLSSQPPTTLTTPHNPHNSHDPTDAGASAGAWCCLFMSLGLSTEEWTHSYRLSHRAEDREAIHNAYRDEVWPWLKSIIPVDAYKVGPVAGREI